MSKPKRERVLPDNEAKAIARMLRVSPQKLNLVAQMIRGKKVAALGACEPEVILAGGTYIDVKLHEAYVDGTMVSAKGWTGLAAFMRECLKVLGTEIRHT